MDNRHEKPSLLIVDDDANFGESLQLALDDTYEISLAPSIETAKRSIREKLPDVVLIDLRLPDGDGLDLFRDLTLYRTMPVTFFMTAYATKENTIRARKETGRDFLLKPFEIDRLKNLITMQLEKIRERSEPA